LFSVALIVILCGFLVRRIYDEEKIMKIEFQKVWDTYTQKTWKLLPYIW
jgi:protein-S-isoprenylcysteine O-methyltransferase Ste14